jgi:RES domain-containing protein
MYLWRISNHSTLDGAGGLTASARWHTEGRRIIYLAETPAGALVEALVHLELTPARLPKYYRLLKAEAPDNTGLSTILRSALPTSWLTKYLVTRTLGDNWLATTTTALLRVPSAIVPETFNVLLNPAHPDAHQVQVLWHAEYPWDARLLS